MCICVYVYICICIYIKDFKQDNQCNLNFVECFKSGIGRPKKTYAIATPAQTGSNERYTGNALMAPKNIALCHTKK